MASAPHAIGPRAATPGSAKAVSTDLDEAGAPLDSTGAAALAVSLSTDPGRARAVTVKSEAFSALDVDGESFDSAEPQSAHVFVITVDGPNVTDGGPALAATAVNVYGAVIDARSHQVLETCIGSPCV